MFKPQDSTEDLLQKLVAFDTTSRKSNIDLIEFTANHLSKYGVHSQVIFNDTKTKANLFATIGPPRDGGIVLSGHTDVVPVDGQDWDTNPFILHEADGKLFGRGTADMKGFCAVVLSMVPEFLSRELLLPIHLAFSYDEEVGCLGVHSIIPQVKIPGMEPKAVIVGEPTSMRVVNAHKGIQAFNTKITGLEAHSSATHKGVNAVMVAADLIHFLSRIEKEQRALADPQSRFDPPYTSVHVGPISGGTALNIIPKNCNFIWEYRILPGANENEIIEKFNEYVETKILPDMKKISTSCNIETVNLAKVPPLIPADGSDVETLMMALVGANQSFAVSYGTEAGIFQNAGVPAVVCGPGDIMQAHRPNEFISRAQLKACRNFLRKVLNHASGN